MAMSIEEGWQGITQLIHLTELTAGLKDRDSTMAEIAFRLGVPISDLYGAVAGAGRADLLTADGVHFTDEGYRFLGKTVADRILTLFPSL